MPNHFTLMQDAVDIVGTSPHPTNKVAATLAGAGADGQAFSISRTNYWPLLIKESFGTETRIGNSSGTLHAETACLLAAPGSNGASMYVTDLPCPNCVKNMAEAGIKNLYIDHKGFSKDFALRRGDHFESMSLRICEKAGINVHRIFRKEKRIEDILKIAPDFTPIIERPAIVTLLNNAPSKDFFTLLIGTKKEYYRDRNFALTIASNKSGQSYIVSAESHPCPGYTAQTVEKTDDKYSSFLQPLNRVLMTSARYGLKINNGYLYASRTPTSRELVDMVGAELTHIIIGDPAKARDPDALAALKRLMGAGIITTLSSPTATQSGA